MRLPSVPPGLDSRLEFFLEQIRKMLFLFFKRIGSAEDDGGISDDIGFGFFNPVYESSATILAGTGEGTSTEDAWTTLASGAPVDARFAIIQFRGEGSTTVGSGAMQFRKESGAQEITAFEYPAGNNDESIHIATMFVELSATGGFDYIANTTGTAYTWKIYRLGYSL